MSFKYLDYMYEKKSFIRFSSNQIKIVAMITMLIDHIGLMLIGNGKLYGYNVALHSYAIMLNEAHIWNILYRVCRMIGRISFPIYSFCIVEGFLRTKNLFKYFVRIFILAVISEIPFDLMVSNCFFSFDNQNVLFTYCMGIIMLYVMKKFKNQIVNIIVLVITCVAAYFARVDYSYFGIIHIAFIYSMATDRNLRSLGNAIITFVMSLQNDFGSGILSTFFIHYYDGTRGAFDLGKLFYLFYPCHMLILYGIVYATYMLR